MNYLVPEDAVYVRYLTTSAYELSRSDCGNAHIIAPFAIISAAALSSLNSTFYLFRGVVHLVCCEMSLALDDFAAVGDSLGMLVVGVCLFVYGVFFPSVFDNFKPDPVPIPTLTPAPIQYTQISQKLMNDSLTIQSANVARPDLQRPRSLWESFRGFFVDDTNHCHKLMKYRHWMNQLAAQFPHLDADITDYRRQTDPLSKAYVDLLLMIRNPRNAREQYQTFVRMLDAFVNSDGYKNTADYRLKSHVGLLCILRWSGISMTRYYGEIVGLLRDANSARTPEPIGQGFIARVLHANAEVERAPTHLKKPAMAASGQKVAGALGLKDFTADENTPNLRSIQKWQNATGQQQQIFSVRHGSPTTAGTYARVAAGMAVRAVSRGGMNVDTGEAVASNYSEMVRAMGVNNRSVFFTCLQRNAPDIGENEQSRIQALRAEQDKHDNFFFLMQSLEGDFYKRTNDYARITTFEGLTTALCNQFKRGGMCELPKLISPAYCDNELPKLCQAVQYFFFNGRREIASVEEWKAFILLCYLFQRWDLQFRLGDLSGKPVAMKTNPCKDYLDRGGLTALVESMVMAAMAGKLDDNIWMQTEMANVIGPAIAVKKQGVIEQRLKEAEPVYQLLKAILPERLAQLRQYAFCGRTLITDESSVLPSQEWGPSLQSARTREEFQEALRLLCLTPHDAREYSVDQMQSFVPKGPISRRQIEKECRRFVISFEGQNVTLDQLIQRCGSEDRALLILHYAFGHFATEALTHVMGAFQNVQLEYQCRVKQHQNQICIRRGENGRHILEMTNDLEFLDNRLTRLCDIRTKSVIEIDNTQIGAAWDFAITDLA